MSNGYFDIEVKQTWFGFGAPRYILGWRNSAGFGPIDEFRSYEDAQTILDSLQRQSNTERKS